MHIMMKSGVIWVKLFLQMDLLAKALPYLQHAYKVTGDVPGINYLLAAFYLLSGNNEKAYHHLSIAIEYDKELFTEFKEIFPEDLLNKKVKKTS